VRDVYANRHSEPAFLDWIDRVQPEEIIFQHTIRLSPRLVECAMELGVRTRVILHDFFYICPRVHRFRPDDRPCYDHRHRLACRPCLREWYWKVPSGPRGWWDLQRIFKHLQKVLARVDVLEAPSDFVARVFKHFGLERHVRVRPLGLVHPPSEDLSHRPARGRPALEPGAGPAGKDGRKEGLTFGYVGGYMPYKGVELLLQAFLEARRRGCKARLALHGIARDAAYIEGLKSIAAEHRDASESIHWGGEFAPHKLHEVFAAMDVLVVPSLCEETYSFAAREALAFGLPVIGADAGALPEALRGREDCRLFRRGDLFSLASVMESFWTENAG
jgi:glycosyltransferase involved in cell wall biosynthesis